jgi:valyl-tRNA synthetase
MELGKNFEPASIEKKWTAIWSKEGYFKSQPNNKPAYTVVIPPPNVTGVLHMGHTLNETVQDILVRNARMSGYNACWVPGSDHASIATEAKVVNMLKEQGIDKNDLTREEFLKYAFEWKEKYGGIIYDQIKRLGCSVDWDRVSFTMDKHYYDSVIKIFVTLYNKGLIYRGARMINWDVAAKTALSDEEVEFKDATGKLYYVKYIITDEEGKHTKDFITIATQRPETIMGDTAACFNPNDERYKHLKGKKVLVPLINRAIPVIFDDFVDASFGTGCLKVTPAHDINDYNIGLRHNLEIIDTLNDDGTLSEAAQILVGVDRFKARKQIVQMLSDSDLLVKEEEHPTRMGYSQRTGVVVEPKISTQWFLKMEELAKPALHAVTSGEIKIHPGDRFMATYKHWLENVKDWCISRQLWWGQQIPAWYSADGKLVVAETETEAKQMYTSTYGVEANLTQDPDVLDTWFSSWLWPIEVFKGITNPDNKEYKYYYPTATLVTGQDIIFFWVARMVMAGMYFKNEIPFKDVYFTGMVRDKQGRKMSKSLGNSPDLLQLIDNYGADAVRFGIMISSPAGNDLLFNDASLEQGKFFNNKLWNVVKLLQIWKEKTDVNPLKSNENFAINWFADRLATIKTENNKLYTQFKLSEVLKNVYNLIWDDYCSWYLEWIKPNTAEETISKEALLATSTFFEELMTLLHPFMPFVTEELHEMIAPTAGSLSVKQIEPVKQLVGGYLETGTLLQLLITSIRDVRNKNQLKPKETIQLIFENSHKQKLAGVENILKKQVNAETIAYGDEKPANAINLVVEKFSFYVLLNKAVDAAEQQKQLTTDLAYYEGFLQSVMKKLGNEKFVANAKPEVVALETKKKLDAEEKIQLIKESLASL